MASVKSTEVPDTVRLTKSQFDGCQAGAQEELIRLGLLVKKLEESRRTTAFFGHLNLMWREAYASKSTTTFNGNNLYNYEILDQVLLRLKKAGIQP